MKKIAVSGVVNGGKPNINPRYFNCISQAGGAYAAVYPLKPHLAAKNFDGLVICGGGDIHPEFFGQQPLDVPMDINIELDKYELSLCHEFILKRKPILGICRGMQVLNVALGGTIYQDIVSQLGLRHSSGEKAPMMHEVKIVPQSYLHKLLGEKVLVNSFHHQSVDKPGKQLFISGFAQDGIVEAIESSDGIFSGVQWHPERMDNMQCIFDRFINQIKSPC